MSTAISERRWWRELSRYQWLILAIAWFGWVFDIADTALFNFAKVRMMTQMLGGEVAYKRNGPAVEGTIQAFFFLGWAIGGLFFGILADRWGRTRTLVLTVLLYCLFTGLTALCQEPWQVGVARFLTALGIGGEWAAGAALVAEAMPDRARSGAASILQSAAAFGPILAALANLGLAGKDWRWLFVVGVFPALIVLLVRAKVKELERRPPAVQETRRSPLAELFADRRWRRNAVFATIIGVVGVSGAGTATFWTPNLVKAASVGLPQAVIDQRTSYVVMISHIGTLLGVFAAPWLCWKFGRKPVIFAFFLATPIAVALAIAGGAEYRRLLTLLPMVNFFAIGVSAAFVLYFPELFPTRMRATGAGLAYNVGRVLSIPMPIITAALIGAYGGSVAIGVLLSGGVYLLGMVAIPFAPETKGLPLPE